MSLQSLEIFDYLCFFGGDGGELQGKILHLRLYTRQPPGFDSPTSQRPGKHALGWHGGTRARLLSSLLF